MASKQIRPIFTSPVDPAPNAAPPPPNFGHVRAEVSGMTFKWTLLNDCLAGERAIKDRRERYLPIPRVDDDATANAERYTNYLLRAVFYNATRRTLDGLVGQVFSRDPNVELPEILSIMRTDADGAGVSLDQQSKMALSYVMGYGRGALLADYPKVEGLITQAELDQGLIRPSVILFKPDNVINWRTKVFGGRKLYTLVVIKENCFEEVDAFEMNSTSQWRVLRLRETSFGLEYYAQIWRQRTNEEGLVEGYIYSEYVPTDAKGQSFTEIPFTFVGSLNNDEFIDEPPMYDLATLNIAHYRNSADYEEACFMVGQPTAWFSGLTQEWVEEVFKGKVFLGSRAAIPLPLNAQAGLLQVTANSMPKEAMDQKERQMSAMGAKLIVDKTVQRTLGEAQIAEAGESSILSTATKNVSAAYQFILEMAAKFVTSDNPKIVYDLNTDFPASRLTPNDRAQLVAEWQSEAITWDEMRNAMRRGGIATEDSAVAKATIAANPPPAVVAADKAAALLGAKPNQPLNNAPSGGNQDGQ